jgi:hypothetical protein
MYEFPYLSLHAENASQQAVLVIRAFAQQTILFEKLLTSGNTLHDFAFIAGLIGFSILVISWAFQKVDIQGIIAWSILFLITLIGAFGETLFFTELREGQVRWMDSPYCVIEGLSGENICPPQMRTARQDLESEGVTVANAGNNKPIMMFTPQIYIIHYINIIRAELVKAFDGIAREGLTSRFAALRMAQGTRVLDYRPHYDMAMFMQMCGRKVPQLMNQDWVNSAVWVDNEGANRNDPARLCMVDRSLCEALRAQPITFGDIVDGNTFFWNELRRTSGEGQPATVEPHNYFQTTGLPPLVDGSVSSFRTACRTAQTATGSVVPRQVCDNLPLTATIFYDDSQRWRRFLGQQRESAHVNYNQLQTYLGNLSEVHRDAVRNVPVSFVHARLGDDRQVEEDRDWLARVFGWWDRAPINNCEQFQQKVAGAFISAFERQSDFNSSVGELITAALSGRQDLRADELPANVRARIAYEALLNDAGASRRCFPNQVGGYNSLYRELQRLGATNINTRDGENRRACTPRESEEILRELFQLRNFVLSSAMQNALPETEALVARSGRADGYFSPIRNVAAAAGEGLAPVAVFFKALFGGFEAGTYSGIMPSLITWFIALTILCTPLIYMIGLIIPQWSFGVLLTPIITVLYFKSVELSFVLIKQVFHLLSGKNSLTGEIQETALRNFHDILLGMAYTSAFAVSLVLLFGLRNPAGLIQGLAGKVDNMAKVSAQEAMAMVGTVMAGLKVGAMVLPGGALVKGAASLAGAATDMAKNPLNIGQAYADSFQTQYHASRQERAGRRMIAMRSNEKMDPIPTEEVMQMQARAESKKNIEAGTLSYAAGAGVAGQDRKPKTYQQTLSDGTILTRPAEEAVLQLATQISGTLNIDMAKAGKMASDMLATGAVKTAYNTNNRQVQFNIENPNTLRSIGGGQINKLNEAVQKANAAAFKLREDQA